MFGKFTCRQCRYRFPYQRIVRSHYICLGCYAWARGVMLRNVGKPLLEQEVDILLGSYMDYPWGCWQMLTTTQAEYLLAHDQCPQPILSTCGICHKYYRDSDAGQDRTICQWCEKALQKLTIK